MKNNYATKREEYLSFFQRIRSKEDFELTGKDYINLRTNLLAALNEHIIDNHLMAEVGELVRLPLSNGKYKNEIDKTLNNVIKSMREIEKKSSEESKFGSNLVAPDAEKSNPREMKISSIKKKSWVGYDIKFYGKGLPEGGFEGIGFEKDAILFFNELLKYMMPPNKEKVEILIDEEKKHLIYLSELKKKYE